MVKTLSAQELDYKPLYEQLCEQYDVLAKELETIKQALAAQPAVQEPVAWFWFDDDDDEWKHLADNQADADKYLPLKVEPLYTTPPAQPAVALSRERVKEILAGAGYDTANVQARADFLNGIRHGEAAHGITGATESLKKS